MAIYLTVTELANKLGYSPKTIHNLKNKFFVEGVHYIRPFGGNIRFIWEEVEQEINKHTRPTSTAIPMANGGVCYG